MRPRFPIADVPELRARGEESSSTPAPIAHGAPLVLLTSESVGTLDSWYASHSAKDCHRQDMSGTTKFACPGASIMVYAKEGKTQIASFRPSLGSNSGSISPRPGG